MTDNTERAQVGWGFWLRWVLASGVGIVVGIAVSLAVAAVGAVAALVVIGNTPDVDLSDLPDGLLVLFGTIASTSIWASVGIAQWLVLRWRQVPRASLWVLATAVGGAVGGLVSGVVTPGATGIGGDVLGASVGVAQWLVLRRWQVPRAGWWVLTITVSLAAHQLLPSGPVTTAFNLAGYGAITGGVMVWLLRQHATEEPSLSQEASSN